MNDRQKKKHSKKVGSVIARLMAFCFTNRRQDLAGMTDEEIKAWFKRIAANTPASKIDPRSIPSM